MIKRILTIFIVLFSINLVAQRSNSSPYSFFGIGEEFKPQTVEQASMGGIGVAYKSAFRLNFINPATNADLRVATYSLGGLSNNLTIQDNSNKQKSNSTSLSYISLGLPVGQKAGLSVGIQPISSVGYSLLNSNDLNNDGVDDRTSFNGTGGASRIYGSFGIKITKDISVGIEGSYIFGNLENNITTQVDGVDRGTKNQELTQIRGGIVKFGVLYEKTLKDNLRLTFGSVFKLSNKFNATGTDRTFSVKITPSGIEIPKETLSEKSISEKITNPLQTILGVGLGKTNIWFVGVDYEFQQAFQNPNLNSNSGYSYGDSNRLSIGGFYIPKSNSISSYWDRVTYRAGFRFEKTGLLVNNTTVLNNFTEINDFGMSFGLSLPLNNQLSNINLGLEYGQRGTLDNNLIKENYFNFRLSLSLNDVNWFKKRKID